MSKELKAQIEKVAELAEDTLDEALPGQAALLAEILILEKLEEEA